MKRVVLVFVLMCVLGLWSSAAAGSNGEGTLLDPSSLPEGWVLIGDYLASPSELEQFSVRLGVQVVVLRNYVFSTPAGQLQVNLVLTETEQEAASLQELFLSFHPPENVGLSGRRVIEVVTEIPELARWAQEKLVFSAEESCDQAALQELRAYLEAWSWPVFSWQDLTENLAKELPAYRIFLVGESHGAACNQELESALLQFLVQEGGVRSLLLELSPSIVGFLREYVATGDEALLEFAFSQVRGTYFFTRENYNHWQHVRRLAQALPAGEELRLIGLDIEHQPLLAFRYLQHLLDGLDDRLWAATKLAQIGQVLRGELRLNYTEAVRFTSDLLVELETEEVKEALGRLWGEVELVLSSLLAGLELQTVSGTEWNNGREQAMYANLLRQVSPEGGEKYFGQWGLNHVFQGQQLGVDWLASRIDQMEGFAGSILSLVLVYSGSERISQDGTQPVPLDTYRSSAGILADLSGEQPLLVKLDGPESPFTQNLIWKLNEVAPTAGVTTDYYQYILFVPRAQASSPLAF